MNAARLVRVILATLLAAVSIALTVDDRDASGQTTQSGDGTIEILQCDVRFYRSAALATDRPGVIAEMPFDEGHRIREGDLVVRLRDDVAIANLALATERAASVAGVRMAEQEAAAAAVDLAADQRANERATGSVPDSVIDQKTHIKQAREFAVARAEEEVALNARAQEQAQAELDSFRIVSKQSGIVTRVLKREGEAVQQGEAILEVIDPSVARIEGELDFLQARKLRVGMPVEVRLDFEEEQELAIEQEVFTGTIGFIGVSASPSFWKVRVWAEVQNRNGILLDKLPARMTVDVGG